MAEFNAPDESTRLLGDIDGHARSGDGPQSRPRKLTQKNILLCMVVYFFHQMQDFLPIGPHLLLYERSICYTYYATNDPSLIGPGGLVKEMMCKIKPIQRELATIQAWEGALSAVPVFLVAVPYGKFADRHGKKKVIAASLIGLILARSWTILVPSFPIVFSARMVWIAPIFWLIGGGNFMPPALLYLMASEHVDENQRSRLYYLLYCVYLGTELVGPYIASNTMDVSLYIPMGLTIACLLAGLLATSFIDEPNYNRGICSIGDNIHQNMNQQPEAPNSTYVDEISAQESSQNASSLRSLFQNRVALIALFLFIVPTFRPITTHVLLQYMSVRFQWHFSDSTILISEIAVINIVLFLFFVPKLIQWIQTNFEIPSDEVDLGIVRASLLFLFIGSLLIWWSPSPRFIVLALAIFASGFGVRVSLFSFATSLVETSIRAQLYGVIQIMENIGFLMASPILQGSWARALDLQGRWLPLPFLVVAGIFAFAIFLACFLRTSKSRPRSREENESL